MEEEQLGKEADEPTYVDLFMAAVAQEDEQALESLLSFAAMFQDTHEAKEDDQEK
jgi:hypothetical protein